MPATNGSKTFDLLSVIDVGVNFALKSSRFALPCDTAQTGET